jgi:hypothetical protein
MMLGVTSGRGNSRAEVLDYLRRSAAADGTHPRGTIYFVQNGDVRSRVRQEGFPAVVRLIKARGVEAEILEGKVPLGKDDVQGAMLGTESFDWKSSGSTIRPGAICEHFTSYGGDMHAGASQTPLSELLRYGAAAASGTVTEPYAVPDKFPAPVVQLHYVRGCTVAEAFYQSILSPYQLLIVGDPLCRPWANIPAVAVRGVEPSATVKGMLHLQPSARYPAGTTPAGAAPAGAAGGQFQLYVDGLLRAQCGEAGPLDLDTTTMPDGAHELRIVAIDGSPLHTQGRTIVPIHTANYDRTIDVTVTPRDVLEADGLLVITVKAPKCIAVCVRQGTRTVGRAAGQEGRMEIKASLLGAGPVRLQLVGLGMGGLRSTVFADPIELLVQAKPESESEGKPQAGQPLRK